MDHSTCSFAFPMNQCSTLLLTLLPYIIKLRKKTNAADFTTNPMIYIPYPSGDFITFSYSLCKYNKLFFLKDLRILILASVHAKTFL